MIQDPEHVYELKLGFACGRWNAWLFPWASCDGSRAASPYTHLHVCFTSTSLERVRTYTHASVLRRPSGKTLDALSACAQVSVASPVTGDFPWTTAHLFTHVEQDVTQRGEKILRLNQRVWEIKEVNLGELFNILQGDTNCCQKRKCERK